MHNLKKQSNNLKKALIDAKKQLRIEKLPKYQVQLEDRLKSEGDNLKKQEDNLKNHQNLILNKNSINTETFSEVFHIAENSNRKPKIFDSFKQLNSGFARYCSSCEKCVWFKDEEMLFEHLEKHNLEKLKDKSEKSLRISEVHEKFEMEISHEEVSPENCENYLEKEESIVNDKELNSENVSNLRNEVNEEFDPVKLEPQENPDLEEIYSSDLKNVINYIKIKSPVKIEIPQRASSSREDFLLDHLSIKIEEEEIQADNHQGKNISNFNFIFYKF